MRDFREAIARDDEPHAVAALVQRRRRAFVRERVIDAPAGPALLALFDETQTGEVQLPLRTRVLFSPPACVGAIEGGARRIFFQRFRETGISDELMTPGDAGVRQWH